MTVSLVEWLQACGRDFTHLRLEACIDKNRVLALLEVSKRTFQRWSANNSYPIWAIKLVAMEAGYLVGDGWQGWRVGRDGKLYSPALLAAVSAGSRPPSPKSLDL